MRFCDNLRNLRKQRKISQEKLAEEVNVSRQSVSKWECGEAYPSMDNILKLCEIFHCKLNDLVHENLTDINSLDEEVKMNIVKFKKDKQKQVKGLSKAIYIIARIGMIAIIVGIISVCVTMIATPFLSSNIKVKDNKIVRVFNHDVEYERDSSKIAIITDSDRTVLTDTNQVEVLNIIIDKLENNSIVKMVVFIEFAFSFLVLTLVLLYLTLQHLEQLFKNIHNGDTPFTMSNVNHIKRMAILMIITILVPNIVGIITEKIIGEDLGIGFEMFDFIYILFLFSMSYIFEYGYQIQMDSKGKMYGEENE